MNFSILWHNFNGHLKTINSHKLLVMKHCFQVGLYKQGLLHDLSKYTPVEFIPGVIYFQGDKSPNKVQREVEGCSTAWLHHKGRNKHHYEYWIDLSPIDNATLAGMKMPVKYVVEMFCDRIAASKIYYGDKYTDATPLEYYIKNRDHYLIHSESNELLKKLLTMLAKNGEDYTFRYIRHKVLKCI